MRILLRPKLGDGSDPRLRPRPELLPLAAPFYSCYAECSSDRGRDGGGGPLPIPRASLTDWLNENEVFDRQERRDFRLLVGKLDRRSRTLMRRRQAQEHNKLPGAKPVPVEVDDPDEDELL